LQPVTENDTPTVPATSSGDAPGAPSRSAWSGANLGRGFLLFLVLTGAAFWFLSRRGTLGEGVWPALRTVHPAAIAIGCLQALLDQVLGGLRICVCARVLGATIGLWPCVLANCANVFLGGVTPSQHAGGPAQIFILMRNGMRFTEATVTSFCTYLGTVSVFLFLTLWLARPGSPHASAGLIHFFTGSAALLFGGTLLVGAVALPRPQTVIAFVRAVVGSIPRFGPRLVQTKGIRGLERLLLDYSLLAKRAWRQGKLGILAVIVLSGLIYLNKFLVGYVVARGLGLHPPLRSMLELQALQALVTYFVPTPGASGVAEVTAAKLMNPLVPRESMGAFIILWRTLVLYVGMAMGALALLASGFAGLRGNSRAKVEARSGAPQG
jgi:uncharacterized protein (TIRG00374 family)